ncbi:MAG: hypothetical protein A2046_10835 [Bacteroidetes bacterium GWA2_30_7]|nr:MAG: hypothetical protein A2046_10835 [Bacteroidetes bacterium GWA2_30_7]
MDIIHLLTFQLIAHLLTDFNFIPKEKALENYTIVERNYLKWHIVVVFAISWLLSFQLDFIFCSIILALSHLVINGFNNYVNKYAKLRKYTFFSSQFLHILIIVSIVVLYYNFFETNTIFIPKINIKYLLLIAGLLACTKPSNVLIKAIFNFYDIKISDNNELQNAGKLIGIIERFLVITFIVLNQFEAVGFLIAAKSILRYKDDSTLKTEYVLIGTMLSFGIAIIFGVLIKYNVF